MAASRKTIRKLRAVGQRPDRLDHRALVRELAGSTEPLRTPFYDATSGLLFGLLLHSLRDTGIAEEVLSLIYVDVREDAPRFDHKRNSLLVWLVTLAHWRVTEQLRFRDRPATVLIGPRERGHRPTPQAALSRAEHQRQVSAALSTLSPIQLQMIELAFFSRLAPLEIALRLGQRLETVKVGLQDGMFKLCRLFKSDFGRPASKKRLARAS